MAALLEWGAERGATTAYLQVLGDNARALALYDGLGFVEHHRYRYLAAPRKRFPESGLRPKGFLVRASGRSLGPGGREA